MPRRQTAFERDFHSLHGDEDLDAVQTGPSSFRARPAGLGYRATYSGPRPVGGRMSGTEITARLSIGLAGLIIAIMLGVVLLGFVVVVLAMLWTAVAG